MLNKLKNHIKELENLPEGVVREIETNYGSVYVKFHKDTSANEYSANPVTVTSLFLKNVAGKTSSLPEVVKDLLEISCLLENVQVSIAKFEDTKIRILSEVLDLESTGVVEVIINVNEDLKTTMEERIQLTDQLYKQGYTQTEIATRLNVSQKTISNYIKKLGEKNVND